MTDLTPLERLLGEDAEGWNDMFTLPPTGEVIARTMDGREMRWHVAMLRAAMAPTLSAHLKFPAIAWKPTA